MARRRPRQQATSTTWFRTTNPNEETRPCPDYREQPRWRRGSFMRSTLLTLSLWVYLIAVADAFRGRLVTCRRGGGGPGVTTLRTTKQHRLGSATTKVVISQTVLSPSWVASATAPRPISPFPLKPTRSQQPMAKKPRASQQQAVQQTIHTLRESNAEVEDETVGDFTTKKVGQQHLPPEVQVALAKEIRTLSKMTQMKIKEESRVRRQIDFGEWAALVGLDEGSLSRQVRKAQQARSMLITTNVNVVYSLALQYYKRQGSFPINKLSVEDLVQEGVLGLIKAAERFDPERGNRFVTYAYWWIRQTIANFVALHSHTVRLPIILQTQIFKVRNSRAKLYLKLGREPLDSELAATVDMPVDKVHTLRRSMRSCYCEMDDLGLEATPIQNAMRDPQMCPKVSAEHSLLYNAIEEVLEHMEWHEREILRRRWGLVGEPLSRKQIALELQSTSDKVRRAEEKGRELMRIRQVAAEDVIDQLVASRYMATAYEHPLRIL